VDVHIDWAALDQVYLVGVGVSVTVVVVFALGVLADARRAADIARGRPGGPAATAAGVCFTLCALMVGYGLYLIVPQFHHH
jgi:hypothetical protein